MKKEMGKVCNKQKCNFHEPTNALDALEQLFKSSRDSEITDEYLAKAELPINYIIDKYGITPVQAVLLSIILEVGLSGCATSDAIGHHLGCSNIFLLSLSNAIDDLLEKKIVCRKKDYGFEGNEEGYAVTKNALEAMRKNESYDPKTEVCESWEDFITIVDDLIYRLIDGEISANEYTREIADLCNENSKLALVKKFNKWSKVLNNDDLQLLIFLCVAFARHDGRVESHTFGSIFNNRNTFRRVRSELKTRNSALLKKGLVENVNCDGVAMADAYQLTQMAKKEFFPTIATKDEAEDMSFLQSYKQITPKALFYNAKERSQIDTLFNLMEGEHLAEVQSRLVENGMRTGVCCLLYGTPGTGKTTTVLEIARRCERDIFQVNLSEFRSKWVGDSERICQKVWDDYNALVSRSKRAPIFLLNECDGILTTRKHGAEHSVDKMENTLAAIFLENMEKQKGIVIATTNLAANLDPAFERRFIYKICLGKPCAQARQSIWKSMLPKISDADAETIAKEYDFSGGQIENIARKSMIDYVLSGKEITLEHMREYCRQEGLLKEEGKSIGFGR